MGWGGGFSKNIFFVATGLMWAMSMNEYMVGSLERHHIRSINKFVSKAWQKMRKEIPLHPGIEFRLSKHKVNVLCALYTASNESKSNFSFK